MKPPDRIYLQWYGDEPEPIDDEEVPDEVTWAANPVYDADVEYIRKEIAVAMYQALIRAGNFPNSGKTAKAREEAIAIYEKATGAE